MWRVIVGIRSGREDPPAQTRMWRASKKFHPNKLMAVLHISPRLYSVPDKSLAQYDLRLPPNEPSFRSHSLLTFRFDIVECNSFSPVLDNLHPDAYDRSRT